MNRLSQQFIFVQQYFFGLWLWLKSWLVVPSVYLLGVYCCVVELYIDCFRNPPLKERIEEWKKSSLLTEHPQEKKIAVITGADGTIGTEISRLLLELGFEVAIFGLRRPGLSYLHEWDRLHLFKCDLLIPNQVHRAINDFERQFKYVDLCIFNAGIMFHPRSSDPNAVDPHFTVNLLSHALIFESLRSSMERSLRASPKVITLSSSTCHLGELQRFIYGNPQRAFRQYRNGYKSYADSKLYVSLYSRHLANKLQGTKIKSVSVHPGIVSGSLYRYTFRPFRFLINNFLKFVIRNGKRAAIEVLNLAFNDMVRSGQFYEHLNSIDFGKQYNEMELRRLYGAIQVEIR